jgi:uncharacterized membrane protein YkoI
MQIITQNTRYTFEELVDLSINELNLLRGVQLEGVSTNGTASDKDYIGAEAAGAAALAHAGLSHEQISKYEIEMGYEKGAMVYEIEFDHDGYEYEYEYDVDARTGEILKNKKEKDDDKNESGSGEQGTLLSKEQAMAAALAHAGLSKQDVEQMGGKKDKDDGRTLYEIEFTAGGYKYEYEVDAATGAIVKYEKEQAPSKTDKNESTENKKDKTQGNGTPITAAKAKEIALAHAGVSKKQAQKLSAELAHENGVTVYEVEFEADGYEYEYDVDAATGAVIKHEKEIDD